MYFIYYYFVFLFVKYIVKSSIWCPASIRFLKVDSDLLLGRTSFYTTHDTKHLRDTVSSLDVTNVRGYVRANIDNSRDFSAQMEMHASRNNATSTLFGHTDTHSAFWGTHFRAHILMTSTPCVQLSVSTLNTRKQHCIAISIVILIKNEPIDVTSCVAPLWTGTLGMKLYYYYSYHVHNNYILMSSTEIYYLNLSVFYGYKSLSSARLLSICAAIFYSTAHALDLRSGRF